MITALTAPAPALTREELASISAATPSTFSDIPPLLRHKEDSVHFSIDPECQGFSSGKGVLTITEGAVNFFDPSTSTGLSIPYPHITLHAISRAPLRPVNPDAPEGESTGGGPCIYCQVDESEGLDPETDEDGQSWELVIVPDDATNLDKIFETLSACAALHPPPHSSSGGDDGAFFGLDPTSTVYADPDGNIVGGDWADESEIPVMTAEEEASLGGGGVHSAAGRAALAHLATVFKPRPTSDGTATEGGSSGDKAGKP